MLCKINLRNLCFEQGWLLGKLVLVAVGRTGRDKYHVWVFTVSVPCTVFNTQTHMLKPSGDKKHATALPSTRIEEKLNIISQFSGIANLSFVFPFSWFLWISIKFQSHLFAVYGYLASEPVLRRHLFHIQPGCRQKSSPFMNLSHHPHPTTTLTKEDVGWVNVVLGVHWLMTIAHGRRPILNQMIE